MPDTDGSRIVRLEERLLGVREDVSALVSEQERHRNRLHQLEGICATFVDQQRQNRRGEERQYRRLELRLQMLTVVIAITAIATPIVIAIATGK